MQDKDVKEKQLSFSFRVKIGENEVEICGTRDEVMKTIDELPSLIANINEAFEGIKPKTVTKLVVKREMAKEEAVSQQYPKIQSTEKCDEAIIRILESDWGKWRPRTVTELKEALKANEMNFPNRALASALLVLANKGKVRRWKTDAGYVYILAEKEALA